MMNWDGCRSSHELFPCTVPGVGIAEKNSITTAGVPPKIQTSHHNNTSQMNYHLGKFAQLLITVTTLFNCSCICRYVIAHSASLWGHNRERLVIPQYQQTGPHCDLFIFSVLGQNNDTCFYTSELSRPLRNAAEASSYTPL
jgi:hypothetical protein